VEKAKKENIPHWLTNDDEEEEESDSGITVIKIQ
jgi:hypothetical protein